MIEREEEIRSKLTALGEPGKGFAPEELEAIRQRVLEWGDNINETPDTSPAGLIRHAFGYRVADVARYNLATKTSPDLGHEMFSKHTIAAHVHDYMMERERQVARELGVADLLAEIAALRAEVERLTRERDEAKFSPLGDNHHNAHRCPYCSPDLVKRESAQNERLRDLSSRAETAEARVAVLEGALRVFAEHQFGGWDDDYLLGHGALCVGDFRRAAAALAVQP